MAVTSFGGSAGFATLGLLSARDALAAVDAHGHVARNRDAPKEPALLAVVVDRIVLRRAIVPHGHVPDRPAPAHRVFVARDVLLEHLEQVRRVEAREPNEFFHEMAEHERTFARFRV